MIWNNKKQGQKVVQKNVSQGCNLIKRLSYAPQWILDIRILPILKIMIIFTCFTLQYIKPMIENKYLILFFAFYFFSQLQIRLKIVHHPYKIKSVKQKRLVINVPIFLYFHQKTHLDG